MKNLILTFLFILSSSSCIKAQTDTTSRPPVPTDTTVVSPTPAPAPAPTQTAPPPAVAPAPSPAPAPKSTRPHRSLKEKFSVDLSTSFWVNTTSTFFEFSPVLFYHFPRTFSVGAGPTYIYQRDRVRDISLNGWGGKVIGRAWFTKWLYGWTEYQVIDNQYISEIDISNKKVTKSHETVDSWFLSLGISLRTGKRSGVNLQALYDVLYDEDTSPYYSPLIYRISFGF